MHAVFSGILCSMEKVGIVQNSFHPERRLRLRRCAQCDVENKQIIRLDSPLIKPSSLIGHGLHQLLWLAKAVRVLDCVLKGS